ncbi:hypothetical protein K438DRAFT_1840668 [Mycena galopus ATCC 62051]|nr:hypothetical protein K438DRAFT_1840668 [Mycena galopus ATCC 62051]
MIVSYMHPLSSEGMAQLAALAQCNYFHSPALDALWRHQGTIQNLISCMPQDLWVVDMVYGTLNVVSGIGLYRFSFQLYTFHSGLPVQSKSQIGTESSNTPIVSDPLRTMRTSGTPCSKSCATMFLATTSCLIWKHSTGGH